MFLFVVAWWRRRRAQLRFFMPMYRFIDSPATVFVYMSMATMTNPMMARKANPPKMLPTMAPARVFLLGMPVWMQPRIASHVSTVLGLPSEQLRATGTQAPVVGFHVFTLHASLLAFEQTTGL